MEGNWSMLREIGDETTFASQPAFILPLNGQAGTEYLYVGDRWNGKNYHDSRYIFLPIRCLQRGRLVLEWAPEVGVDAGSGRILCGI